MQDPDQRKYFFAIFGGKLLGLVALFITIGLITMYLGASATKVHAQDTNTATNVVAAATNAVTDTNAVAAAGTNAPAGAPATPPPAPPDPPYCSPINTMWVLVTAFLVFFMQAGFMFLEAGFARERETVNVLLEGIVDTCLCGILFYAFGFAWMFGHGNGYIGHGDAAGHGWYFLQNLPDTYESTGVATLAYFLFQFAFADTCSTITSGAMLGRTGFWGDLWYSIGVSGFCYPIFGHWAWGPDGWLNTIPFWKTPFHDFAGSTVVHTIGGQIALVGAIVLGPRIGRRFKRDGGGPMPYHNMTIASVGAVILWFGWYGFNPGSTLSAMDIVGIGRVAVNTTLAACSGGLAALFFVYPRSKKWDCGATLNGLLAGLVAITCPCYWVSPTGAIILGAIAGVIVILATDLLEYLRIDDPCGAWPVHGACGIWGTLSLGLFATGQFGAPTTTGADNSAGAVVKGLFYGGGPDQLVAQIIGNFSIGIGVTIAAVILMYAVKATGTLRVTKEGEIEGLDLHEHGGPAYPDTRSTSH
ncbi:MAG TPA: ammonium transporter [Verrucomicrobiae bacterium]|nr:ammonium transporter [Verrucomicrobiae bacterium]